MRRYGCILVGFAIAFALTAEAETSRKLPMFFCPATKEPGASEMRVVALGTGTPNVRRSQASACSLAQLGNGDTFLFDVAAGSLANLASLEIPSTCLDKVFISHLHVDQIRDLDALHVGGRVSNRTVPLRVRGPSGLDAEYGTAASMDDLRKMLAWDIAGRRGNMPSSGGHLDVTEFDHSMTQVVHEADGVVIRSSPALHSIDGAVSYGLEWNGLKFVCSGDTNPNRWFVENARDSTPLGEQLADGGSRSTETGVCAGLLQWPGKGFEVVPVQYHAPRDEPSIKVHEINAGLEKQDCGQH